MAQTRPKQPIDVLQSMINGILIEVGRALRASDKDGGRTLTNANTRLRSFFPGAIENFHQALDDFECDIVRAKAILLRDLEELRAQRVTVEDPPIHSAKDTNFQDSVVTEEQQEDMVIENNEPTSQPIIKEEEIAPQAPDPEPLEDKKPAESNGTSKDTMPKISDSPKVLQGPSPPSSNDAKSIPVGLGIDTSATTDDPALATAGPPDSSIDSLFDMPDSGNNDGSDLNFDSMDFLDSSNAQGQSDFDLSTFGNSQDFSMADLHTTNDGTNNNSSIKQDDIFDLENPSGGSELMDLDLELDLGTAGGDNSALDIFFGVEAGNTGGGGEMEHGDYDNAFFGLD